MPRFNCSTLLWAALVAASLATLSALASADNAHLRSVVNCDGMESFPHLDGWSDKGAVQEEGVYLLNLYYSSTTDNAESVSALNAGLTAAMKAVNYTTEDGRPIVIVDVKRSTQSEDLPELYVAEAICRFGDRLLGVLGPFTDNRLKRLMDDGILQENGLIALGPYTGSSAVRFFSPNMYFMRADPIAELFTMLNYIVNRRLYRRVAYVYLTNRNFGEDELIYAHGYLTRVGSELVSIYSGDANTDAVDTGAFQHLVDSDPQAIVLLAAPVAHSVNLMKLILREERLREAKVFVPSFLNSQLESVVSALEAEQESSAVALPSLDRDRLFSTATNFPAYSTSRRHIRAFRKDMEAYIESGDSPTFTDVAILDSQPAVTETMVNGWIVGKMLSAIFFYQSWSRSREALMAGMFSQQRYVIGTDFVLGDYGGECESSLMALQGATCECNQGGSSVFLMQHFANHSQRIVMDSIFSYGGRVCYAKDVWLPSPVNIITMKYQGDDTFERINVQLQEAGQLAMESLNSFLVGTSATSYNIRSVASSMDDAQTDLDEYMRSHRVDVIMGPVLLGTETYDTLVLSPAYRKPHATFADPNKVVLRASLNQQLYVVAQFLKDSSSDHFFKDGSVMHIVCSGMDDENTDAITDVIKRTTETLRLKSPKIKIVSDDEPLENILEKNAVTFFMGLQPDDPVALVKYLEANQKSFMLLNFQDLAFYYDQLVEAFSATTDDVSGRVVFATSFPMWNDDSEEAYQQYPILKAFHAAMGNDPQHYTPRAFETYITARLVDVLASSLQTINANELREQLYHTSNFLIDDFRLGPFSNCDNSADKDCQLRNYGANDISIVSMRSVLDKSQKKLYGPVTPAMTYSKPPLSTGAIVGIAVGGGLALIALIVVPIVVCMCCFSNSRDNKNAPQCTHDPVTVIFTDIQNSTALWGTVPQIMPDAIATHHKIIREAIAEHKGYEVKTVGDSFMIACKRPFAAVQIAQDIQKRFLTHSWEEDIDECYRQFERQRADDPDNDSYTPHSANLVRDVYSALWNGLRVRIGVHTGLADIRHDEITGGFDYYGETSNMAARTEAIGNGGQVLLTDATWWALSQDERDSLDAANLGPQPLRGVRHPVEMYQLNVVAMRAFPPLRLEIDAYLPEDDETNGSMATDELASSAATLTGPAAAIATVLTNCFSPYPPPRRIKELQPLLQKWGIAVPPRHRRVAEEDYCQGLINRLSLKMSSVVQLRSKMDGGRTTGTLGASGTTAGRSRGSAAPSIATVNPLETVGGLDAQSVARLQYGSFADNAHHGRGGTRASRRASRQLVSVFSPLAPESRGLYESHGHLLEMTDATATGQMGASHGGVDDGVWQMYHAQPLPRAPARHRGMGLAALSVNSETFQSVHVAMPEDLQ